MSNMTSISKSTSPLKRFHCAQCSKTYTKLEHLTRHERTHTNTKPFQCKQCGRSFGRQDVLGRHMKLHADTSTPTPTPPQTVPVPDTPQSTGTGNNINQGDLTGSSMHIDECMSIDPFGHQSTLEMDSDGLLEWLMPDFHMASVVPLPFTDLPSVVPIQANTGEATLADIAPHRASGGEKTAIHQIYTLIEDLSKRLHSDLHNTGIKSAFLDACLHEFFNRVSPSFPVLHEPTFSTREAIPPLLLNMVALGSLFVCLPNSVQKGEILWRLGHTAVATSWQTLVGLRGPHDGCDGVQVVLTALLGQTYALLSSNTHIRMTALVFHGLGFYWARTCGMYAVKDIRVDEIPDPVHASESEKETAWKDWTACEVQRQAILGHYILDGLISQASGSPASARHLINSISSTCSDSAFSAKTANEWIVEMKQSATDTVQKPLSEIFVTLFSDSYTSTPMKLSNFSLSVLMEGLQSLVSDVHESTGPVFGIVSKSQIIHALLNLYNANLSFILPAPIQLLIRWHTICLELCVSSSMVYRHICDCYKIPQTLAGAAHPHNNHQTRTRPFELDTWAKSADAIRALLHASAISRLLDQVPFGQAHAPHIPAAIFGSAMVFGAVCIVHGEGVCIPNGDVCWDDVWADSESDLGWDGFLRCLGKGDEASIHLLNEMNFLQTGLKTFASRWGVSAQMEEVIRCLAVVCRERLMSSI